MCTLSSSPPDVHTPHTPHTCTPHTVRLSDGRTLRATDLLAVSSLLGCWDQPRKLHVCPGRYGIVVGSRVRGRSRDARPGVSSLLPVTCYLLEKGRWRWRWELRQLARRVNSPLSCARGFVCGRSDTEKRSKPTMVRPQTASVLGACKPSHIPKVGLCAKAGNSQRSGFCKARRRTHHVHVQDLLGSAPRLAGVAGRAVGLVLLGHHTSGLAVLVRTRRVVAPRHVAPLLRSEDAVRFAK